MATVGKVRPISYNYFSLSGIRHTYPSFASNEKMSRRRYDHHVNQLNRKLKKRKFTT